MTGFSKQHTCLYYQVFYFFHSFVRHIQSYGQCSPTQECYKIWPTCHSKRQSNCFKCQGKKWTLWQIHVSWYCQSCCHFAFADVFHLKVHYEIKEQSCQKDTAYDVRWQKWIWVPTARKLLIRYPKLSQWQCANIVIGNEILVSVFEPVRKKWKQDNNRRHVVSK